jgi:hypothetical protein
MEQFRVRLRAPTGLGISSKREKREGYYQRYWLHEVSVDLETRDEWDRNSTLSKVQAIYKDSSNCFISAFSFRQYWPVTMQKRQSWHGLHRSDALWRFGRWGKRLQAPLLIGDLHRDLHLVSLGECDGVELCFSIMDILQYYSLVHLRPRLSI